MIKLFLYNCLIYDFFYLISGEQGALTMMPLFLVDKGMTSYSVGFWTGLVGQGVSILGSFLGGWLISVFLYGFIILLIFLIAYGFDFFQSIFEMFCCILQGFFGLFYSRYWVILPIENSIFFFPNSQAKIPN